MHHIQRNATTLYYEAAMLYSLLSPLNVSMERVRWYSYILFLSDSVLHYTETSATTLCYEAAMLYSLLSPLNLSIEHVQWYPYTLFIENPFGTASAMRQRCFAACCDTGKYSRQFCITHKQAAAFSYEAATLYSLLSPLRLSVERV